MTTLTLQDIGFHLINSQISVTGEHQPAVLVIDTPILPFLQLEKIERTHRYLSKVRLLFFFIEWLCLCFLGGVKLFPDQCSRALKPKNN